MTAHLISKLNTHLSIFLSQLFDYEKLFLSMWKFSLTKVFPIFQLLAIHERLRACEWLICNPRILAEYALMNWWIDNTFTSFVEVKIIKICARSRKMKIFSKLVVFESCADEELVGSVRKSDFLSLRFHLFIEKIFKKIISL